jgi:hypothetical protein
MDQQTGTRFSRSGQFRAACIILPKGSDLISGGAKSDAATEEATTRPKNSAIVEATPAITERTSVVHRGRGSISRRSACGGSQWSRSDCMLRSSLGHARPDWSALSCAPLRRRCQPPRRCCRSKVPPPSPSRMIKVQIRPLSRGAQRSRRGLETMKHTPRYPRHGH